MDFSRGFGQRVRFLRRLKGQTQGAFASEIPGATQTRISRLEKAQTEALRIEFLGALVNIAVALGVPVNWFICGDGPLDLRVSPERFSQLQGVDVPPGVQLIPNEQTQGCDATESGDDNDMDVCRDGVGQGGGE